MCSAIFRRHIIFFYALLYEPANIAEVSYGEAGLHSSEHTVRNLEATRIFHLVLSLEKSKGYLLSSLH